jgi:hypothetical protein
MHRPRRRLAVIRRGLTHPVSRLRPRTSNLTLKYAQLVTQDEDLDLHRPLRAHPQHKQLKRAPQRPIDQRDHDPLAAPRPLTIQAKPFTTHTQPVTNLDEHGRSEFRHPQVPDPDFLKIVDVAKERFLKPARMARRAGGCDGGSRGNRARRSRSSVAAAYTARHRAVHRRPRDLRLPRDLLRADKAYVKPVAIAVFDVITPALLAIPLLGAAVLQLATGRRWRSLGSAQRFERAPETAVAARGS